MRQTSRRVILRPHNCDFLLLITESETKRFPLVFSAVGSPMCIVIHGVFLTIVHMSKLVQILNICLLLRVSTNKANEQIGTVFEINEATH